MKAKKNLVAGLFVLGLGMWLIMTPTGNTLIDVILPTLNIFMAGCNVMLCVILNFMEEDKKRHKRK